MQATDMTTQDWGYVLITIGTLLGGFVLVTTFVLMIVWAVRTPYTVVARKPALPAYRPQHQARRKPVIQTRVAHSVSTRVPTSMLPKPADPWLRTAETEIRG